MPPSGKDRVLLTGISGFLGGHIALALLAAGYSVRGSLRRPEMADRVRATLASAGADIARLELVTLDLLSDSGWDAAMAGCRYLVHTASPLPIRLPADRMALIRPAVDGTERALEAALRAGVERIVLTSSMAAIAYGHGTRRTAPFTALDWTDPDGGGVNAYQQSKTLAERRAWEIMDAAGRHDDLVAINPAILLGPLLDEDPGTSAVIVQRLLDGSVPAVPRIPLTIVDVRDVAAVHVAALGAKEVGGQRLPMGDETISTFDLARLLREAYPERRVPRLAAPLWVVRLYALFDRDIRDALGDMGQAKRLDSTAATALLGRALLPAREAILATAATLRAGTGAGPPSGL